MIVEAVLIYGFLSKKIYFTLTARDKRHPVSKRNHKKKTDSWHFLLKQWDQNYELWMLKLPSHIFIIMTANFCFV